MAIKCGRCQCYHETVADVKACCAGGRVAVLDPPATATQKSTAVTDGQWKFLNDLRVQVGLPRLPDSHRSLQTKQTISQAINDQKIDVEMAKRDGTWVNPNPDSPSAGSRHLRADGWKTITAGYYAIPSLTGHQDLDFFKIDVPEDGAWQGYVFVKRVLGGGADTIRTERVAKTTAEQVLTLLIPPFVQQAARERFGREIGRCGCCGRQLTDETSRARGIGPDCWARS